MTTAMPESATVYCPLLAATIDIERCAVCRYRSGAGATCAGDERRDARDLRWLLRRIPL